MARSDGGESVVRRETTWPKRVFFGAAGAAAGAPLLLATCPGNCTSCYRCGAGAVTVLALLVVGHVGRRIRGRNDRS